MKRNRKLFITIITLITALLLVSCASKNEANKNNTPPPVQTAQASSTLGSFTAHDINGNAVNQDIFKNHDLTMINIWATFCPPCIREMPDLGKLNKEYADKNFQVIGIVVDVLNDDGSLSQEQVELAKEIITKTNANYLHLIPSEDLINAKLEDVNLVPETIFVDKSGNIVGQSYVGARSMSEWKEIVDKTLKEVK